MTRGRIIPGFQKCSRLQRVGYVCALYTPIGTHQTSRRRGLPGPQLLPSCHGDQIARRICMRVAVSAGNITRPRSVFTSVFRCVFRRRGVQTLIRKKRWSDMQKLPVLTADQLPTCHLAVATPTTNACRAPGKSGLPGVGRPAWGRGRGGAGSVGRQFAMLPCVTSRHHPSPTFTDRHRTPLTGSRLSGR